MKIEDSGDQPSKQLQAAQPDVVGAGVGREWLSALNGEGDAAVWVRSFRWSKARKRSSRGREPGGRIGDSDAGIMAADIGVG